MEHEHRCKHKHEQELERLRKRVNTNFDVAVQACKRAEADFKRCAKHDGECLSCEVCGYARRNELHDAAAHVSPRGKRQ